MFHTLSLLALLGGIALAGDPPAPADPAADCSKLTGDAKTTCENALALKALQDEVTKLGDCSKLQAEAKTACDTKLAELTAKIAALQPPPPTDGKAGKATRSDTNRMEAETDNE